MDDMDVATDVAARRRRAQLSSPRAAGAKQVVDVAVSVGSGGVEVVAYVA
jgi:hypothetical protein